MKDKKIRKNPFRIPENRKPKPNQIQSKQTDSLEAQAFYFKKKRKDLMQMYGTYKEPFSEEKIQEKKFNWEGKSINAGKIEEIFLRFFNLPGASSSHGFGAKKVKREPGYERSEVKKIGYVT